MAEVRVGGWGGPHATRARQRLLGQLKARICVAGMPRVACSPSNHGPELQGGHHRGWPVRSYEELQAPRPAPKPA
jgi:hypothetical protein